MMRTETLFLLMLVGLPVFAGCGAWRQLSDADPSAVAVAGNPGNAPRWWSLEKPAAQPSANQQTADAVPVNLPETSASDGSAAAESSTSPTAAPANATSAPSAPSQTSAAAAASKLPEQQQEALQPKLELLERQLAALATYVEQQQTQQQSPPLRSEVPERQLASAIHTGQSTAAAQMHQNPLLHQNPLRSETPLPQEAMRSAQPSLPPPATGSLASYASAAAREEKAAMLEREAQRVRGMAVVGQMQDMLYDGASQELFLPESAGIPSTIPWHEDSDWREHLQQTIEALERQQASVADEAQHVRQEAYLRLLYLVAARNAEAVEPIDLLDPAQREYWKSQLHGLHVLLADDGAPLPRRSALALFHLREAEGHLMGASTLDLQNLAFCKRVDSYGHFVEFEEYRFKPDQEVLLYVEVENFQCETKQQGHEQLFETELEGHYRILDLGGRRMIDYDLPPDIETCRNRRRDYFLVYRIYMPKTLPPGQYRLQLTIRDKKADKSRQTQVDFEIL